VTKVYIIKKEHYAEARWFTRDRAGTIVDHYREIGPGEKLDGIAYEELVASASSAVEVANPDK
jgi:hypothetical protein